MLGGQVEAKQNWSQKDITVCDCSGTLRRVAWQAFNYSRDDLKARHVGAALADGEQDGEHNLVLL
jgi:hypothetical protein